jgi:hypothetical protein
MMPWKKNINTIDEASHLNDDEWPIGYVIVVVTIHYKASLPFQVYGVVYAFKICGFTYQIFEKKKIKFNNVKTYTQFFQFNWHQVHLHTPFKAGIFTWLSFWRGDNSSGRHRRPRRCSTSAEVLKVKQSVTTQLTPLVSWIWRWPETEKSFLSYLVVKQSVDSFQHSLVSELEW